MDFNSCPSLVSLFFEQAKKHKEKPFLWAKSKSAGWQPLTWSATADQVLGLASALKGLGIQAGDRVVLVSENRPQWAIADLAIMAAGAITVPAYTTNTVDDHCHILEDSGAVGVIVSGEGLGRNLIPAANKVADCRWTLSIDNFIPQDSGKPHHQWDDLLADASSDAFEPAPANRDDVACFIYTSGTGGAPKGVMLTHGSVLCNCMGAHHLLQSFGLGEEVFLSFLPLSHSYEHTAGLYFPIAIGAEIYYAESADQLLNNMGEVRPTIMTAVPRLYEAMHQRIRRGVAKEGGLKEKLFKEAERLGLKKIAGERLGLVETIQDKIIERLVREKVRQRFGGRLKAMVSGGAALNPVIGDFFTSLGLRILQGYGQTEASPVISANPPGGVRMETVGPPLKGVELRIAEDGEILVKGELVMKGYWRNEEATSAALQDGWLHTGDIGELDPDGYLRITDRKKDIIVLSGGDNISPARVESILTLEGEIAQAMVYGDKQAHLVALLVVDESLESLDQGDCDKTLAAVLERVNAKLSTLEKVRRFIIAEEAFSVENEMLTPTLKIRRHVIKKHYGEQLEQLYAKR